MTATADGQPPQSPAAPPKITEVETHGVEPIPDAERAARPLDLFRLVLAERTPSRPSCSAARRYIHLISCPTRFHP
jgi:hypothetical protein